MAAIHLTGVIAVTAVIGAAYLRLLRWLYRRNKKQILAEYARELRLDRDVLPVLELDTRQWQKFLLWLSEQYRYDDFRNRLSDLLGQLWTIVSMISGFVLLGLATANTWSMFNADTLEPIVTWWSFIPLLLAMMAVHLTLFVVSMLLTDRGPGQARAARKDIERMFMELRARITSEQSA